MDGRLVESGTQGHGFVYCQILTKYYFLGTLISTEEDLELSHDFSSLHIKWYFIALKRLLRKTGTLS